ncbi:MAG: alpha/beta fold hydrolase [Rhizobiales bacterium]|nr:alpha/beta fold hydrolase [Hyphomicrobiales bacterium]
MLAPADANGPVILIIPGSGPTDRNGNNPLGLKAASYRLLAEGLAAEGITSVRVDKRGMFGSAKAITDGNAITIADYAADVHAWIAKIREAKKAPCVWVAGHSEGGLVALATAQGQTADICGLVLIAAPGRSLGEILRAQFKSNPANAPILADAMTILDALEAGRKIDVSKFHPVLQQMFYPGVQGFLIDEYSYDPAKLIASYAGPVLILQGERDIQIDVADARLLKAADDRAKLVLLPDTNHVLKTVTSDDRHANVATYGDPSLPLAPGVVDAVAGFVTGATH